MTTTTIQVRTVSTTPERILPVFPSALQLGELLDGSDEYKGDIFCYKGFADGLNIGVIPEVGPTHSFDIQTWGSGNGTVYLNLFVDTGTNIPLENSSRGLGYVEDHYPNREIEDALKIGLGSPDSSYPNGPIRIVTSGKTDESRALDPHKNILAIGSRAVGAYAIGRAFWDLYDAEYAERRTDLSTGLLLAAHLEESGYDWRPRGGRAGRKIDRILDEFEQLYYERAVLPGMLRELGLTTGWTPLATPMGNRLPLFHTKLTPLTERVMEDVRVTLVKDEKVAKKHSQAMRWHGTRGNYDAYAEGIVRNFLANRVGLTD